MNLNSLDALGLLTTATELNGPLKGAMIDYLEQYRDQRPETEELVNSYIGVLRLHGPDTRAYLKYSDMELLNAVKCCLFYRLPIETAKRFFRGETAGYLIYSIWSGNDRAHSTMKAWKRNDLEQLEDVKNRLYGVRGANLTDVKLENGRRPEDYRLTLIERKDEIERDIKAYREEERRYKAVRTKITDWINTEAPEGVREQLRTVDRYDKEKAGAILEPYAREIALYAGMNAQG